MARPTPSGAPILLRRLGRQPYQPVWEAMQSFTAARGDATPDELWLLEHPPVFTQGLNGREEHLLSPGDIPVIRVDRGGQITYHGPGQAVLYVMVDLRRRGWGVRKLVEALEESVIALLAAHGVEARGRRDAPGVYVGDAKVAALGLRVRRGRSYHGLSLNGAMDLSPFARINPCGYRGMPVTALAELGVPLSAEAAGEAVARELAGRLGGALIEQEAAITLEGTGRDR